MWQRVVSGLASLIGVAIGGLFGLLWHERYWRWRDCFNDDGRCYDPNQQIVYAEQAGVIYAGLTIIALVLAAIAGLAAIRKRRRPAP